MPNNSVKNVREGLEACTGLWEVRVAPEVPVGHINDWGHYHHYGMPLGGLKTMQQWKDFTRIYIHEAIPFQLKPSLGYHHVVYSLIYLYIEVSTLHVGTKGIIIGLFYQLKYHTRLNGVSLKKKNEQCFTYTHNYITVWMLSCWDVILVL